MPTDDTDDHEESLSPEARERLEAGLADARAGRYRTVDVAMFDDTDPAAVAKRKLRRIADHLTYCPHPKLGSLGDAEYCYRCGSIRRWGERHWTSPNLIDALRAAKEQKP